MAERAGCETPNLEVAGSNPIISKVILIQGLFLFFLISLYKAVFCRVFASVCGAQLRLHVFLSLLFSRK